MEQALKYAIILPDGAADEPVVQLEGRTPLEAANTPHIDWISSNGRQGCVVTIPDDLALGSDVATLSLFGYDPLIEHSGRAPLEALARGIEVRPDQLIFRCNLVTIADGVMQDFTAGHISSGEAKRLMTDLNQQLAEMHCRFHPGISYRNLMIASDMGDANPQCTPPHDFPDQPIAGHLPRGPGADFIKRVMERAHAVLAEHDVNLVRRDLGENPAMDIWLWGQGRPRKLQSFKSRFGKSGAVIAAVDLIRGIAVSVGMDVIEVKGATGYLDTDYVAKGSAAVDAVDRFDLVIVHIESPDEAGHLGDLGEKILAIERIDEHVVGPLLDRLRTCDDWKIMIAPDHPTPISSRVHTRTPPPFCIAGSGVQTVLNRPFSEASAAESDLQVNPGHELMEYFLKR